MANTILPIKIALVGAGPRGLGAIEALVRCRSAIDRSLELTVFDDLLLIGAGPNFDPAQSPLSMLNTPMREIDIPPALPLPCGSFSDWQKKKGLTDGDRFPSRAELGAYLIQRFRDVAQFAGNDLELSTHKAHATRLHRESDGWYVLTRDDRFGPFDEVLLVPGQPQTAPDDQWASWVNHTKTTDACAMGAYPDRRLLAAAKKWTGCKVGIRGLGLSTFDVVRYLTSGQGGIFENGTYYPSGAEPGRVFAFSLDGQPPFPKPADEAQDARFTPSVTEIEQFGAAIAKAVLQRPDSALEQICDALIRPTLRISAEMEAGCHEADVRAWLQIECAAPGDQETRAPTDTLKHGIDMAMGTVPPTAGYIIGQIWRKMQNELRTNFNRAEIEPDTAEAIVGFDEGLKRYSFGPPLRSSQELLALINCNLVSLSVVYDPDITLVEGGWHLVEDDAETTVSVMIDAVFSPPSLNKTCDALIAQLKSQNYLTEKYAGSGAKTRSDGQVINASGNITTGLCMLGRLALGSVIAVDSIHDCFGASKNRWAEGVMKRAKM